MTTFQRARRAKRSFGRLLVLAAIAAGLTSPILLNPATSVADPMPSDRSGARESADAPIVVLNAGHGYYRKGGTGAWTLQRDRWYGYIEDLPDPHLRQSSLPDHLGAVLVQRGAPAGRPGDVDPGPR